MKQPILFLLFLIFSIGISSAQNPPNGGSRPDGEEGGEKRKVDRKFADKKEKQKRAPINSYKIISIERDTTYADTSLTIQKEYKFNYLRKDNFELQEFVNVGSTYSQLAKQDLGFNVVPHFGASAKHLGFLEAKDVNYYQVATPFTELYYKTALEQGQQLDAFISFNTSPNLNFSLKYKGVRSLGAYESSLTSTKSFQTTVSYSTKNKRYVANAHFTDQRLLSQENGGFDDRGEEDFRNITEESDDRTILTLQFEDAENLLDGKRYFLDHEYRLITPDSSGNNRLAIGHQLDYTNKKFYFSQENPDEEYFGLLQSDEEFLDRVELNLIQNKVSAEYANHSIGELGFFAKHTYYNYGYNNVFFVREGGADINLSNNYNLFVDDRLIGETISIGASYKNTYKGFLLEGNAESVISGEYSNQYFLGTAGYNYKDKLAVKFGYEVKSEAQSFNKLLYQSNYVEYFWQNGFDNTLTNTFSVDVKSKKDLWINASFSIIDKYAYFGRKLSARDPEELEEDDEEELAVISTPEQSDGTISLVKIKGYKEFAFGNIRLANTIMFQETAGSDANLYNVPNIVTRNSLYYQNTIFDKAMFLQAGITFKYFSSYNADGYDPLIADYYVQDRVQNGEGTVLEDFSKVGDYPQLDFFLNARIRQTRIFFKLENMQHLLSQNNDFSAPSYASRDFLVRFGLVWNFYL